MRCNLRIIGLTIAFVLLAYAPVFGQEVGTTPDWPQVVERIGTKGKINWSVGYVEATGIGVPPEECLAKPQARFLALKTAQAHARQNVLQVVNGIRLDSEMEIRDLTIASDVIKTQIDGLVQGAQIVKRGYFSDDAVEVVIRIPLYGDNSVVSIVMPVSVQDTLLASAASATSPGPVLAAAPFAQTTETFTGLVVDVRGIRFRPTLKPKILDENGKEIYRFEMADPIYAVQQGISLYTRDLTAAQNNPRVTSYPLTIKALRSEGTMKGDVVVDDVDASGIGKAADNSDILKKCRVIIVLD
jgi:hypothetical protein